MKDPGDEARREADAYTQRLQLQHARRGKVFAALALLVAPPLIWLGFALPGEGATYLIFLGVALLALIPEFLGLASTARSRFRIGLGSEGHDADDGD